MEVLHGYFWVWGVPLHKPDRWVPLFYIPETFGETATCFAGIWNSQMQVVTCVHGTTSSLQASEIGGRWERSPGKVNQTKWLVLRMIHGSRIPGSYQMGKVWSTWTDFLGKFYLVNSWIGASRVDGQSHYTVEKLRIAAPSLHLVYMVVCEPSTSIY